LIEERAFVGAARLWRRMPTSVYDIGHEFDGRRRLARRGAEGVACDSCKSLQSSFRDFKRLWVLKKRRNDTAEKTAAATTAKVASVYAGSATPGL